VRAIRDEHLLTQDELAGRTGLSRYQLCRWEKGSREPPLEMVRRVLGEQDPRICERVDEFPMTVAGKVRKVEMRRRSVELLGLQQVARTWYA
jgi:transcriptional regulator with XRE-family HTH domain